MPQYDIQLSLVYMTVFGTGFIVGSIPHEIIHWTISRWWTDEVEIIFMNYPPYVNFHSPYDLPKWGMALTAAGPMIIGVPLAFVHLLTSPESAFSLFVFGVLTGIAIPSGSDLYGLFCPGEFQKYCDSDEDVLENKEAIYRIWKSYSR